MVLTSFHLGRRAHDLRVLLRLGNVKTELCSLPVWRGCLKWCDEVNRLVAKLAASLHWGVVRTGNRRSNPRATAVLTGGSPRRGSADYQSLGPPIAFGR